MATNKNQTNQNKPTIAHKHNNKQVPNNYKQYNLIKQNTNNKTPNKQATNTQPPQTDKALN